MNKGNKLYEGKAKIIYETKDKDLVIQHFKDDATAFNNLKKASVEGKGVLNNRISEYLMQRLNNIGVPTHFMRRLNMREQLVREVEIIPITIVTRNVVAGSLAERFKLEEGSGLPRSVVEFYYKSEDLSYPMVTEEHITAFGWAYPHELDEIISLSLRINDFLSGLFLGVGLRLIDFKLEFGRLKVNGKSEVILADEISPDTCRLWDSITDKKLDKDRFRKDLGDLIPAYTEVAKRLGILHENSNVSAVNVTKLRSIKKRK